MKDLSVFDLFFFLLMGENITESLMSHKMLDQQRGAFAPAISSRVVGLVIAPSLNFSSGFWVPPPANEWQLKLLEYLGGLY